MSPNACCNPREIGQIRVVVEIEVECRARRVDQVQIGSGRAVGPESQIREVDSFVARVVAVRPGAGEQQPQAIGVDAIVPRLGRPAGNRLLGDNDRAAGRVLTGWEPIATERVPLVIVRRIGSTRRYLIDEQRCFAVVVPHRVASVAAIRAVGPGGEHFILSRRVDLWNECGVVGSGIGDVERDETAARSEQARRGALDRAVRPGARFDIRRRRRHDAVGIAAFENNLSRLRRLAEQLDVVDVDRERPSRINRGERQVLERALVRRGRERTVAGHAEDRVGLRIEAERLPHAGQRLDEHALRRARRYRSPHRSTQ